MKDKSKFNKFSYLLIILYFSLILTVSSENVNEDKYVRILKEAFTQLTKNLDFFRYKIEYRKDKYLLYFSNPKLIGPMFNPNLIINQTSNTTIEATNMILTFCFSPSLYYDNKIVINHENAFLAEISFDSNEFFVDEDEKLVLNETTAKDCSIYISDTYPYYSYEGCNKLEFKKYLDNEFKEKLKGFYIELIKDTLDKIQKK